MTRIHTFQLSDSERFDFSPAKNHSLQFEYLPLADDQLKQQQYKLDVYTGTTKNSGTESNIYFTLVGTKGRETCRKLHDGIRKVSI
jgi:hypothetical protein